MAIFGFGKEQKKIAPKRFRVWFKNGVTDQSAVVAAVRAWAAEQRKAGIEIDASATSTTEFEVQPDAKHLLPGMANFQSPQTESEVPFDVRARMQLKLAKEDDSKLFVSGAAAIYPEW
jgi:hypothetical protein